MRKCFTVGDELTALGAWVVSVCGVGTDSGELIVNRAAASESVSHPVAANSDQPAHSRSLNRIPTGRILDSQGCKVSPCGQRRLMRLRGYAS